jgi:hypothetical protein
LTNRQREFFVAHIYPCSAVPPARTCEA